ncbi:MAG: sigma-54 interaction domain-containing protein [Bacillota bacterium]|jgi:arginine utilization regulatory protein
MAKQAEEISRLKERIAVYEAIFDHLDSGVYITDQEETIIWVSREILRHENAALEDLVGRKEYEVWPDMYPASTNRYKIQPGYPAKEFMLGFYSANGEKHDILTKSYPFFVGSDLKYIFSIGYDAVYSDRHIAKILEYRNKYLNQKEKQANGTSYTFDDFIGSAPAVRELISVAKRIAVRNSPVMIWGQTGTGKEIIAQGIHNAGLRREKPFIGINCAAIPENLFESLMFGSVKGAFTGAADQMGYLEAAAGGTLFLDEINSMPLFLQNKLLRVLQEKRFTRVGGHRSIEMTCRILCATNQRPQRLIESGQLREDLYFRLSAITLSIPPLKARKGDIPYLVDHFMRKINEENQTEISAIDPACRTYFDRYDWPGNVRELEHVIGYMMNISTEEKCLSLYDLPPYLLENAKKEISFNEREDFDGKTLREIMDSYERRVLSEVLRAHGYNVARCARELGIRRETLYYRLRRLGIEPRP